MEYLLFGNNKYTAAFFWMIPVDKYPNPSDEDDEVLAMTGNLDSSL